MVKLHLLTKLQLRMRIMMFILRVVFQKVAMSNKMRLVFSILEIQFWQSQMLIFSFNSMSWLAWQDSEANYALQIKTKMIRVYLNNANILRKKCWRMIRLRNNQITQVQNPRKQTLLFVKQARVEMTKLVVFMQLEQLDQLLLKLIFQFW